jgi:uncharacterized protein with HEPN domain
VNPDEAEAILALADEVRVGLELAEDEAAFRADWRLRYAAERVVERIFQASNDLPEPRRERYFGDAGIRALRGMRNRLAHNYLDIDEDILWDSLSQELPEVHRRLLADTDEARQLIDRLLADQVTDTEAWDAGHLGPVAPPGDQH